MRTRPLTDTIRGGVRVLLIALVATALTAVPAEAQGVGSITFIGVDGNIWIMAADDPSSARQVTTDGDAEMPYIAPTQSDDGVIYALTQDGYGAIVTLDQTGAALAPPFRPDVLDKIDDLDLSPDGRILAVTSAQSNNSPSGFIFTFFMDFVYADGSDSSDLPSNVDAAYGSFYDDDHIVTVPYADSPYDISGFTTYELGSAGTEPWFDACRQADDIFGPDGAFPDGCNIVNQPQVDRGMQRLAATGSDPIADVEQVLVYDLAGAPPAAPALSCALETADPDARFDSPDWSSDGDRLIFAFVPDLTRQEPLEGAGVYVATGFAAGDCESAMSSAALVAPGATWPDWSPAALGTSAGPIHPGVPGEPGDPGDPSVPGQPGGSLLDGGRLDGGGTADPIAQAIATSQMLFADGAADRVVLATADRFPDVLAGAALAGDDGPILLTAGLGELDPRVAAEITRVTGGDGVVLVLGGTAAVSDLAAGQAVAAAGDRPCTAPLPASCRFAGSGREATAALIGEVVLAQHPGDVALVARGDDFADAITGGAYAAAAGVPILLTPPDMVSPPTAAFLQDHGIASAIVLGGVAAIDEPTYQALPVAQRSRVAGPERTATAAAVATDLWGAAGIGEGGVVLVNVRAADGWQTALTAAVASAVHDAPQLGTESPPAPLGATTTAVLSGVTGPIMAFGGADLVSDDQLDQAAAARG